ncbi:MAG: beta-galactosidase trimerization domain-containing protein [Anaerolineales bacterium]|nr:beta-galactosidase trimerization domain-containing protein [Anaerolineales bacterium]
MFTVPTRQIHLDFHTSELIPGVGNRFSKANFQEALKIGHVNSITIFARCHHGWCYYPTKIGKMHPSLDFDLTGAMMEACHEIGVRAPVYLTNGWFAQEVPDHPDWLARHKDGTPATMNLDPNALPDDIKPGCSWYEACPQTGYGDYQYALIEEICARYPRLDGFFIDINCFTLCYCNACRSEMKKHGLDVNKEADVRQWFVQKWDMFFLNAYTQIKSVHPDASVFFNHCADPYTPERFAYQTHFEMEDMPTVWEGYDRIPFRARFFNKVGKDYVGQTGKFHKVWGEFGTYKNPNALLYECATISSFGAKVNVGDQLHPSGEMNLDTYRLIGKVYSYIESIEPWCYGTTGTSRLGMVLSGNKRSDLGLSKMLLENQLDFDIVMEGEDLTRYDVIILPDAVTLDEAEAVRFQAFLDNGGSLLMTGKSGLNKEETRFAIDVGATWEGASKFDDDYLQVEPAILTEANASIRQRGVLKEEIPSQPFLFYEACGQVAVTDGQILAKVLNPYFTRRYGHYNGHLNTPYDLSETNASHKAGVIQKGNVIWMGHPVCSLYNDHGTQLHRDWFIAILKKLYKTPVLDIETPSAARVSFSWQGAQNRYVLHVTYASPIQRGEVRVIEDLPFLSNVPVRLRIKKAVKRIYLAPQETEIPFHQEDEIAEFSISSIQCHQIIVLDV